MFSGIIEQKSSLIRFQEKDQSLVLWVGCPSSFDDLKIGDSIAVNGVCLTVEEYSTTEIQFTVGYETLKVTGWTIEKLQSSDLNLERSLKFGDRIHGHLVSGHVDHMAKISSMQYKGESLVLEMDVPSAVVPYIWKKGSVTLNGVSLTVNSLMGSNLEVCLIPETLKQTNLGDYKVGDLLTVEIDNFARAIYRYFESEKNNQVLNSVKEKIKEAQV